MDPTKGRLDKARIERQRFYLLHALDAYRPLAADELLLLRALADAGFSVTPADVRKQIIYLESRKLVTKSDRDGVWLVELTRLGIDVFEYTLECEAGIDRPSLPMPNIEWKLAKAQTERTRWMLLKTIEAGVDVGVDEQLIQDVISEGPRSYPSTTLRRELDYLKRRGLIDVDERDGVWTCKLTRHGMDLAEYTIDCDAGIQRPAQV